MFASAGTPLSDNAAKIVKIALPSPHVDAARHNGQALNASLQDLTLKPPL